MPNFSVSIKNNSWYVRPPKQTAFATGWTTKHFKTASEVEAALFMLPNDSPIKMKVFEKLAKTVIVGERLTISEIARRKKLEPSLSGIRDGVVFDTNKHTNFKYSESSKIRVIENKFGNKYPDEITVTDIKNWILDMQINENKSYATINKYVYSLSSLFEYGLSEERKYVKNNIITSSEEISKILKSNAKLATRKKVSTHPKEVQAIIKASSDISPKWHLFFLLDVLTGGRGRELRELQKKNINLEDECFTIEVFKGKVREERVVNYGWSDSEENGNLVKFIPEFVKDLQDEEYLFSEDGTKPHGKTWMVKNYQNALLAAIKTGDVDPTRAITKITDSKGKRVANPKRLSTRDFRHHAAIAMNNAGVRINYIADELGTSVTQLQNTYLNEGPKKRGEELKAKMGKKSTLSHAA